MCLASIISSASTAVSHARWIHILSHFAVRCAMLVCYLHSGVDLFHHWSLFRVPCLYATPYQYTALSMFDPCVRSKHHETGVLPLSQPDSRTSHTGRADSTQHFFINVASPGITMRLGQFQTSQNEHLAVSGRA